MNEAVFFGSSSDPATRMLTRALTVLETGVYRGAHYYSHTPMVRIMIDLGPLEDWPTNELPGFGEALLARLPGLSQHHCSRRHAGGLVERLQEGTWMGHVIEHVAIELQRLAGHHATRGKTRSVKHRPGVYNVMYAYRDEQVGLAAGRAAIELVLSLLPEELAAAKGLDRLATVSGPFDFDGRIAWLKGLVRRRSFGPTTQALVDEADRRGIPVRRLDNASLVQLGHGRYQQRLRASISGRTSLIAAETAGNKDFTKSLLGENGVPVPKGIVVRSEADVLAAAKLGFPLVVKPLDGNHGRGVTTDVNDLETLLRSYADARQQSRGGGVIVEQFLKGRDHRILIVDGQLVAVAERVPAQVTGDGRSSVAALIDSANQDERRGEGHERVMTRIKIDAALLAQLHRDGRTLDSIPAEGEVVTLRATANLSTGGSAIDRTNEIHPENAEIARRAARIIGLDIAGIDFIAPDIARSVRETGGGVIEVNAAPGLRMHLEPSSGTGRDVARPIIEMLFPEGQPARVPILAVTGTNGKSTTCRMVKQILRFAGRSVGLTSTSGVYVDDCLVSPGDATGPRSARMVLSDPTIDVAILETARGGILREGLGYDRADVGAVLNVSPDHLGLKGIDTVEELAEVKSLIVETVSRHGTSVLNADDRLVRRMARRARGRIAWFSMAGDRLPRWLRTHIDEGGLAVLCEPNEEGGTIVLHQDGRREPIMAAAAIPATLHGLARFNVANALAAVAIARANGVEMADIRAALGSFQSTYAQNPGRLNVHDTHGFRVIIDYAHNAAGLRALGEMILGMKPHYRRRIACVSIPGDRRDEDIREFGQIAAEVFDVLYFREDPATRGRPRGEVMGLLRSGAEASATGEVEIHCIAGEAEAAEAALRSAQPGDLLVITPSEVAACWQQVCSFRGGMPDEADAASVAEQVRA